MRICTACKAKAVFLNQAFSPGEIAFLASASVVMLKKYANLTPEEKDSLPDGAYKDGLESMRRLLVAVPEKVRGTFLRLTRESLHLEIEVLDCSHEKITV